MGQPFVTERRVEFRDTDAAGIMHFSVYFTYMEQVEHELFRAAGLSVVTSIDNQTISWPRVAAKCDYSGSFRFEDVMRIEAGITKIGKSSLSFQFQFFKDAIRLAIGSLTTVCCVIDQMPPQSIPIPASIREQISPYVVE